MTTQEKEFMALVQQLTPEDLENLKTIMVRFEDPAAQEIRESFIAEAKAGTFRGDSLARYAQAFRMI